MRTVFAMLCSAMLAVSPLGYAQAQKDQKKDLPGPNAGKKVLTASKTCQEKARERGLKGEALENACKQ